MEVQSEPRIDKVVYLLRSHSHVENYNDDEILEFLEST